MPPFLTSSFAKLLLIAAIVGGAILGIVLVVNAIDSNGYNRAESEYKLQISEADKARADESRRKKDEDDLRRSKDEKNILKLSSDLIVAKSTIDSLTKRLQERASNVSIYYRTQSNTDLLPVPSWIVTNGWVCDYNRAIGYTVPGTGTAVGGAESPSCAADPFSASGVTAEPILRHHEEYGGYCRKLEEQVNLLLDHIEFTERDQKK